MFGGRRPQVVNTLPDPNAPGAEAHPESVYRPLFQLNITENIGAFISPVSMYLCLSEQSTGKLQELLSAGNAGSGQPSNGFLSNVVHQNPFGPGFHGQVRGTEHPDGVPFLAFGDGTLINAGILAGFWTHGYGDRVALQNALLTVAQEQAYRAGLIAQWGI